MLLDGLLSALAITQVIIATLRAGSRIVLPGINNHNSSSDPDLPWILPHSVAGNETHNQNGSVGSLFNLTCAFRQAVKLGLRLDEFSPTVLKPKRRTAAANDDDDDDQLHPYRTIDCSTLIPHPFDDQPNYHQNREPYRMSLLPSAKIKGQDEDQAIVESGESLAIEDNRGTYFSHALVSEYVLSFDQVAQVTAYLPECFADLRSDCFGIDPRAFLKTFLERPFAAFQSNSKGAARTGGVFFVTYNYHYICKTIKRDELIMLLSMMPKYRQYMREQGHTTLLTKVCGLYEIVMKNSSGNAEPPQYLVIMNSVFPKPTGTDLLERFDLKGSTVGRRVMDKELVRLGGRSRAVLKDLNLVEDEARSTTPTVGGVDDADTESKGDQKSSLPSLNHGLHVGANMKEAFMQQLRSDVNFLQNCGVIDYSLLVGVSPYRRVPTHGSRSERRHKLLSLLLNRPIGTILSSPSPGGINGGPYSAMKGTRRNDPVTYYFGVIDFLQPFNAKKQLEYCVKAIRYAGASTYSCVPPRLYGQRFLHFIDQHMS